MNKEFVPYEQALALKELGFDERTLTLWHKDRTEELISLPHKGILYGYSNSLDKPWVSAPLYQQAFRWFRNNGFAINIYSSGNDNKDWYYLIKKGTIDTNDIVYNNYEEAELACIKKLIEICTDQKQHLTKK